LKALYFSLLIVILASCGSDSAAKKKPVSSSIVKTLDGQLYPRAAPLFDCSDSKSFDSDYDASVKSRLNQLLGKNATIFTGFYEEKFLCFTLSSELEGINASALSEEGTIQISPDLDQLPENAFIAVMAHELAHILRRHQVAGIDLPHPWLSDNVDYIKTNSRYLELSGISLESISKKYNDLDISKYSNLEQVLIKAEAVKTKNLSYEKLYLSNSKFDHFESTTGILPNEDSDIFEFLTEEDQLILTNNDRLPKWAKELESLSIQMIDMPIQILGEDKANMWKEIDADTIGLKLFLNAGYEKSKYLEMLELFLGNNSEKCKNIISRNEEPPLKGFLSSSHPSICWRIYNLK
jgi:hypothetical protein